MQTHVYDETMFGFRLCAIRYLENTWLTKSHKRHLRHVFTTKNENFHVYVTVCVSLAAGAMQAAEHLTLQLCLLVIHAKCTSQDKTIHGCECSEYLSHPSMKVPTQIIRPHQSRRMVQRRLSLP